MKIRVTAAKQLGTGSYMCDRDGNMTPVRLHAPSTTYTSRGILHLSPVDAEFLLSAGFINQEEAYSILLYCFIEYVEDELDADTYSVMDTTKFRTWAELSYLPEMSKLLSKLGIGGDLDELYARISDMPDFDELNNRWYAVLRDEYVKVYIVGNKVEFRINSEDGFDWNKTIIDKVICNSQYGMDSARISIMRESSKGYQAYFLNVTRSEILQSDKIVLSSVMLKRTTVVSKDGVRTPFYKLA